ncbi:MAG: repeat protein [Edaphobacter sp.]|nr:repeat protein [Edaphobacter sp.]
MGNRLTSVHATKNRLIPSPFLQRSVLSQSIQSEEIFVFPPAFRLLMAFLIVAMATMNLNAAVIPSTTTVLIVSPSSSVSAGDTVTLTATVTDPGVVSSGSVNFCDATRSTCLLGDGLYGTAQLTRSGTAAMRMRFGADNSNVVAIFLPTKSDLGSKSFPVSIHVNSAQIYPSVTSLTASGGPGNYTLSGEVVAFDRQALNGMIDLLNITANNSQLGATSLTGSGFEFASPLPNKMGAQPTSVTIGDYNGDGFPDLAIGNSSANAISVLLGNGDGSFRPALKLPAGRSPESVCASDFNRDGILDLAVANTQDNTVSILLGNGDGTFQPQSILGSGIAPISIVVGDFNDDGIVDLAVADISDPDVSVLLGNGDGTFQTRRRLAVGNTPQGLVAEDLNGDGLTDLAVVNTKDNTVSILLGNGDGTFQNQMITAAGVWPYSIAVGDFNRDGLVDLAICNRLSDTISLLIGNGDGTFQTGSSIQTGHSPASLALGDFDGDGFLDLAVTNEFDFNISVWRGNGDGTFHLKNSYQTRPFPVSVVVGDFNGDGISDLADADAESVDVRLGEQVASFVMDGVAVPGHGEVTVFATYSGDILRMPSQSPPFTLAATLATTSVVLTSAPNPARFGLPVTLTAIVTGVNGINPTGNVVFKEGSTIIGTASISGGTVTIVATTLAVGAHSIVASYQGDVNYASSTSKPYMQMIDQGESATMTIASSMNPSVFGTRVVFTATLNPGATGTVAFSDGTSVLGVANITASGTASISVSTLLAGSHNITATYSGDAKYF